jgi:two-component system, sensor histidine kinase LadS
VALEAERQLVERLKSSEQQLESRVAERTAELEAANRKLEALSSTDALTGLANRRHFEAALASEWQRAQRSGQLLALGLIDVDWFKPYNDRHGHQAGDACLRRVAELIASCLSRNSDVVARFGGEEFVFIAPATDAEAALNMGRRVCEALQALQLPHEASDYGYVTASIGVAALLPSGQTTPDDLFKAADQAMYRAKREGRNRAVCA